MQEETSAPPPGLKGCVGCPGQSTHPYEGSAARESTVDAREDYSAPP